ncbi:MAG: FliM/FliN family flagellar motor switch protein [Deltaproteobacteria bacterium]|nr:FliM/FliN family flagellar motor switch protein [Deltaproteobacteria bacterium]MBV8454640.1 FliM/FliN family flagellar motor switch protein [Deltaproteobacteria bacterium]
MPNEPQSETNAGTNGVVPASNLAELEIEDRSQRIELGLLRVVPMTVTVEIGRTSMTLGEILDDLKVGSSIRLDRHSGDPAEVYVNGALFALAEVVVVNDRIGAKIVQMAEPAGPVRPAGLR